MKVFIMLDWWLVENAILFEYPYSVYLIMKGMDTKLVMLNAG